MSAEYAERPTFRGVRNRPDFRSFKASGVVVGQKCPDNNARPYAPVGRIGEKARTSKI
jgi:hypothetical protein